MKKLNVRLGSGICMTPWLAPNQTGGSFEMQILDVLNREQKSDAFLALDLFSSKARRFILTQGNSLVEVARTDDPCALQNLIYEQRDAA